VIARGAVKNVFEAILQHGHDEDYTPSSNGCFMPTAAPPGSSEKVEVLRRRVERGQPLWHSNDRVDFAGVRAGGSQIGMYAFEGLDLQQLTPPCTHQEVEQGPQRPEATSSIEVRRVTRRDYSPRIRSNALADRGSSTQVKSQMSHVEPPKMCEQESAASTFNSSNPPGAGSEGRASCEGGRNAQNEEPLGAVSNATDLAPHVLRPPTDQELRLIRAFKQSVGSGVTLNVFNSFMRELASQGVDLSAT
jgi:hypothetical protein